MNMVDNIIFDTINSINWHLPFYILGKFTKLLIKVKNSQDLLSFKLNLYNGNKIYFDCFKKPISNFPNEILFKFVFSNNFFKEILNSVHSTFILDFKTFFV